MTAKLMFLQGQLKQGRDDIVVEVQRGLKKLQDSGHGMSQRMNRCAGRAGQSAL